VIIDPIGYTVTEWTDYVGSELARDGGIIPKLLDENEWQQWGSTVGSLPGIVGQHPPNPYTYDDWLSWAVAFNQVVRY
jgi:hypothetical protein